MAEIPKDMQKLLFGMGAKWHAYVSMIIRLAGMACIVLGVIAATEADRELWLSADHWLLLAIALMLFAMAAWSTAYHAAKEG